jgi:hypothetical protein
MIHGHAVFAGKMVQLKLILVADHNLFHVLHVPFFFANTIYINLYCPKMKTFTSTILIRKYRG